MASTRQYSFAAARAPLQHTRAATTPTSATVSFDGRYRALRCASSARRLPTDCRARCTPSGASQAPGRSRTPAAIATRAAGSTTAATAVARYGSFVAAATTFATPAIGQTACQRCGRAQCAGCGPYAAGSTQQCSTSAPEKSRAAMPWSRCAGACAPRARESSAMPMVACTRESCAQGCAMAADASRPPTVTSTRAAGSMTCGASPTSRTSSRNPGLPPAR